MNELTRYNEMFGLLDILWDGVLNEEQIAHLEEIISRDPTALQFYATYTNLRVSGQYLADIEHAPDNVEVGEFLMDGMPVAQESARFELESQQEDAAIQEESLRSPGQSQAPALPLNFFSNAYHGTVGFFSQEVPFAILMATLFMIVGGLLGSVMTVEHYTQLPWQSQYSADRSLADADKADKPIPTEEVQFVGRITGMVDCQWSNDEGFLPPGGDYVVLGRKYKLDSGLMEITYDTGAKVILQGPVTYEVESANGGYMSVGKLTGKVEVEKAKGFVVRTPTAIVTDLGTEFGVEINRKGDTLSYVFLGRIKVRAVVAAGKEYGREVTLDKDQSAQVTSNGNAQDAIVVTTANAAVKATAHSFVRKIPRVDPKAYVKAVLADKPVFYWTFDEPFGSAFDQVRHLPQQALNMNGFANRCSHVAIGSGLDLGRAADFTSGAGCFQADALGYGGMPGAWAVEFWVQFTGDLSGHTQQYALNLCGSGGNNPAVIFDWATEGAADKELQLLGGGGATKGAPEIADAKWHHVFFVFYGDGDNRGATSRVDILLDGRQQTLDRGGFTSSFDLTGALLVGTDTLTEMKQTMKGRLDELAFYDLSGLTEKQIQSRVAEMAQRHIDAARPNKQEKEKKGG